MASRTESVVVVAVRAEREISKAALVWALTHIVRPGDVVTLLAVLPNPDAPSGWRQRLLWGLPRLGRDRRRDGLQISASCSQMALQIDGHNEVNVRIKVVGSEPGSACGGGAAAARAVGVVATEATRVGANWVVLDKKLKQEEKHCMEELQCSIVVMKGFCPKVLRLNIGGTYKQLSKLPLPTYSSHWSEKFPDNRTKPLASPTSTKEIKGPAIRGASSMIIREQNPLFETSKYEKLDSIEEVDSNDSVATDCDSSGKASPQEGDAGVSSFPSACRDEVYWNSESHIMEMPLAETYESNQTSEYPFGKSRTLQERFAEPKPDYVVVDMELHQSPAVKNCTYNSEVREAVSLCRSSPSMPPPLCSICQHKAPAFGKPPRRFTYHELNVATDGFSGANLVGEGRFASIYKGFLRDGQALAVKKLKAAANIRAIDEFHVEVELLSRAQHRNVVTLLGFCDEGEWRVMVYEYICNGSLELHLNGQGRPTLDWRARVKIALGVARGLRYLHEDCRVGFVVHKHMHPSNILLTHDFEPLLGGFNIRMYQTEDSAFTNSHISKTFGYLAPEFIEQGVVTEKADVYAYGVILLQLLTGRRAMDASQPKGQQLLVEWSRPLLFLASQDGRAAAVDRFLDPMLDKSHVCFSRQLIAMARTASLCLRRDPQARPTMSKILRVLEGDGDVDRDPSSNSLGSRSSRMSRPVLHHNMGLGGSVSNRIPDEAVNNAIYATRSWF